nr:protein NYNRIN-like [Procambarus clarkii]
MGGHMGHAKTSERIQSSFYWPGMTGDIQRYTRSCNACQRTADRGKVQPGKLKPFPIIDQPFKMVSVDIIGPIEPRASDGSRYILTMVDHATRYPEAAPLKNIETVTVAEALVGFFSRLGIPEKIHSDRGAQFTSEMMAEGSTPGKYPVLTVRAPPLHVLKNLWEEEDCTPETKTTYEYVIDLRNRLEETCKLAREELAKAKEYQKSRYDQKARERKFKVGDKVLLLLPTSRNKLLLQWKGPFTITECSHSLTYVVCVRGVNKKYHVNMLKRYEERDDASSRSEESEDSASPGSPSQGVASVSGMTQTEAGAAELGVQPSFEASSRLEPGPGAEHSAPKSGNTTQDESEESPQVSQGDDA